MQLARVIGHATSTIKHASLGGWRLAIVQMLGIDGKAEGDCVVAVGKFAAGLGQTVIVDSDGQGTRELVGDEKSPARWFIIGIVDAPAGHPGGQAAIKP